jgi:uncharacterized protein YgiM (DUF1202 family)
MKMKFGLIVAAMISTQLRADPPPAAAPGTPPPSAAPILDPAPAAPVQTNAPAEKPKKKTAAKKTAKPAAKKPVELKTVPLTPGAAIVAANHVNVRGKAGIKGEVLTRMTNGEPVTVIEEITLKHSGPEEPSAWAKIVLPEKAHAWVNTAYIDATNKTVRPKKLNLRGGPGENYSVIGTLQQGDPVKEVSTKGEWTEIETITNAYAFMAAQYLTQDPAILAASTPLAAATVAENPPMAEATTETPTPTAPEMPAGTNEVASAGSATNDVPPAPVVEEPPPPRIVQREGIVRGSFSIQAPTPYELISTDNHKTIDYLFTPSRNLDLARYKGLHIIVTGPEGLDQRWKNTPIITIQRIQVLD